MRRNLAIILLVAVLCLLGALLLYVQPWSSGTSGSHDEIYRQLSEALKARDPVAEARTNYDAGDTRFMSVMTDGEDVPLVDDRPDAPHLIQKHGTINLGGSDVLVSEAQETYQYVATGFAARYNRVMLSLMDATSRGEAN